jgi:Cu+-exporting ATPase
MKDQGLKLASSINDDATFEESRGMTAVFFGWNGEVKGFITFGDLLRSDAKEVISELRSKGFQIWLASGDSQATTRSIARELGILNHLGETLPADKLDLVRGLQAEGRHVGVVGDGINDSPALAQADLGIAFGSGVISIENASDITILSKDLRKIPDIFRVSLFTTKVIKENLIFAFLYNIFGIPLAVGGILNPLIAVLAMLASSLTVIGNTLRIRRTLKV